MLKVFRSGRYQIFEDLDDEEPWPDDEFLSPMDELRNGVSAVGETISRIGQAFDELFFGGRKGGRTAAQEQAAQYAVAQGYHIPHKWHEYIEAWKDDGRVLVGSSLHQLFVDEGFEDFVRLAPELEGIHRTVESLAEALDKHWVACKHKPRCKRPPEYVRFTDQKTKGKRGRGHWNSTVNLHR